MARQPRTPRPHANLRKLLEERATQFAEKHKVEKKRVLRILIRTARGEGYDDDSYAIPPIVRSSHELKGFGPSLELATESLGPEEAVRLFEETVDLEQLYRREALVRRFSKPTVLFLTHDELAEEFGHLIAFLDTQTQSLIDIGLPSRRYGGHPFLELLLCKCYPTRLPGDISEIPDLLLGNHSQTGRPRDSERPNLRFQWTARPLPDLVDALELANPTRPAGALERFLGRFDSIKYQDVPPLPFLSSDVANRLESLREEVHRTKLALLEALSHRLAESDAHSLWDDCVQFLRACLEKTDCAFLLESDALYSTGRLGEWDRSATKLGVFPGGLSAILQITSHVWSELVLSPLHRARQLWPNHGEVSVTSIYQVRGTPLEIKVVQAEHAYEATIPGGRAFHRKFNALVTRDLLDPVHDWTPIVHGSFWARSDFSQVCSKGQTYSFGTKAAAAVKMMFKRMVDGLPAVKASDILVAADSDSKRVPDLFKRHPAFGTFIKQDSKGFYRLDL